MQVDTNFTINDVSVSCYDNEVGKKRTSEGGVEPHTEMGRC